MTQEDLPPNEGFQVPNSEPGTGSLGEWSNDRQPARIVILSRSAATAAEFEPGAVGRGAEAVTYTTSPLFRGQQDMIIDLAAKRRVLVISDDSDFVEAGRLMAYGPDRRYIAGRLADYVDRILKGARHAGMPVEQPAKFEFAINLRTAATLGIIIPPSLVALADRVIE